MKDLYREETNKDVYAEDCCMQPSSSYSDEYVHWLEAKLSKYNVVGQSEQLPILERCGCDEPNEEPIKICMNCNGYIE